MVSLFPVFVKIPQGIQDGHAHDIADTLQLFFGILVRIRWQDVPLLITGKGINGFPLDRKSVV